MAKPQSTAQLTERGRELEDRQKAIKDSGMKVEWSKADFKRFAGQKGLQTKVRDENLRIKAQLVRIRTAEQLREQFPEYRYARLVPSFSEYFEEMPDADGYEQIKRRKTKQEARGARFTLRHPGIGNAPGEKFRTRIPLDGSGCTWIGDHIDNGFSSEDLVLAIVKDPNWCPREGNSQYYIVPVPEDEVEQRQYRQADEEWLLAQERRRQRAEEAKNDMTMAVEEEREGVLV